MRKFCFVLIPIIIVIFCFLINNNSLKGLFKVKDFGSVSKAQNLGFVFENYETNDYKKYITNGKLVGECITLSSKKENINRISDVLGLMVTQKYYVDDIYIIEGVSSKLNYKINNRQANVQIAINKGLITIGSPIIYGSY